MEISARVDYGLRAMLALAAVEPNLVNNATLAGTQGLPGHFLQTILADLRRADLVQSRRGGVQSGYALARAAAEITVSDIVTALDGALLSVRGVPASRATFDGVASGLQGVWIAAERAIRTVLAEVTLADLVAEQLPRHIVDLAGRAPGGVRHCSP